MKTTIYILFLLLAFSYQSMGQAGAVCSRISNSLDDAEQLQDGTMYFNSTDIELTFDDNPNANRGNQVVGLRFEDIFVPQGAIITSAYIQFTADEINTEPTSVTIRGEDSGNSFPFGNFMDELSNRPTTATSVAWNNIPGWTTIGAAGAAQRTPDISDIVQDIVDRGCWASGNALSLIISGSGQRTAEAYDGSPADAPLLCIEYDFCSIPSQDAYYFRGCIPDGVTVYVSCEDDLSDEALAARFGYVLNGCEFCNSTKTPIFKKGSSSNFKDPNNPALKSNPNSAVCYTTTIEWDRLCFNGGGVEDEFVSISATIVVVDYSAPTFNVPPTTTISCEQNIYNLNLTGNVTNASDNCGIASITYSDYIDNFAINCSNGSTVTRTWTVTDECGNATSKVQTINVLPYLTCQSSCIQAICNESCGDVVRLSCSDNLSDATLNANFGGCLSSSCNPGATPVFSRRRINTANTPVPDANGAYCVLYRDELKWEFPSETYFLILEVIDDIAPTFTVPADIQIFCDEINNLTITGKVTNAMDNCGTANVTYEDDIAVGNCSTTQEVIRTWRVTDPCGNETVKAQRITVYPRGCNVTQNTITVSANQTTTKDFFVNNTIQSTSTIQASADIGFFAEESITLKAGFHAKANSNFRATIFNCDPSVPLNDLCVNATPLFLNTLYEGNGANATTGDSYSLDACANVPNYTDAQAGVWFRFNSSVGKQVLLEHTDISAFEFFGDERCLLGETFSELHDDSRLMLFEGDCSGLTFLDCSDYYDCSFGGAPVTRKDTIVFNAVANQDYFIYLDNFVGAGVGDYDIKISDFPINNITDSPLATTPSSTKRQTELRIAPNPFQGATNIAYELKEDGPVQLEIIDVEGQLVERILDLSFQTKGLHQLEWKADNLPSGMYFLRLQTADSVLTQRMVLNEK